MLDWPDASQAMPTATSDTLRPVFFLDDQLERPRRAIVQVERHFPSAAVIGIRVGRFSRQGDGDFLPPVGLAPERHRMATS